MSQILLSAFDTFRKTAILHGYSKQKQAAVIRELRAEHGHGDSLAFALRCYFA
jgi:hypothetical protein